METTVCILRLLDQLSKRISRLEVQNIPRWIYLQAPLTAAAWDGDGYSDTAKTLIDLSAVFGVPAGVKAILAIIEIQDPDSQSIDDNYIILSPNNTAGSGPKVSSRGRSDFDKECQSLTVPCNATGDIYYEIMATGNLSLNVSIQIWGYLV